MPKVRVNGVQIYYEEAGSGPAVLLIQGLGLSGRFWYRQVPALAPYFRVITLDNRGAGKSDKPDEPYTIRQMAEDARALLDHLRIARAHVIGASMGGYIAQELAISYPERVEKLVLLCTHLGGPEYLAATQSLWREILNVFGLTLADIYRRGIRYSVTPEFFEGQKEVVEELVRMRLEEPQPPHAFQRQFAAATQFDARERASSIRAPTLVLAGAEDKVVPLEFVRKLAATLPKAQLKIIEGAAHLLFIEKAEEVNQAILEFLRA